MRRPAKDHLVLEVGCGDKLTVHSGWHHLDARPGFHIEYVQDASDLSNIPDETYDWIISQNMIEHISWRRIPGTLREWLRVLRCGGTLELETPSAWHLVKILTDPGWRDGTRLEGEGDFEYFNRVLFGHQDYPENTHLSYFTEEWMRDVLLSAGFRDFETLWSNELSFRLQAMK